MGFAIGVFEVCWKPDAACGRDGKRRRESLGAVDGNAQATAPRSKRGVCVTLRRDIAKVAAARRPFALWRARYAASAATAVASSFFPGSAFPVSERLSYCPRCAAPLVVAERDGVERLECTRCGFVFWDNPVPVVAAIVEHEGKIVLGRNALWPPGMFALITGFMEKTDASPESAVRREVKEELALDGEVVGFVGHYRFQRMNQIIIAYHVRGRGHITLDPELAEYRCCAPEALRPWPGATGDALRDWMLARGLTPLPYDFEPLRRISGYRRVSTEVAAGGRPETVQFLALSLARTNAVVALTAENVAERRAAEAVGMRYHALPVAVAEPSDADLARFRALLATLHGQRVYIYDEAGNVSRALAFLYCALAHEVLLETAGDALTADSALPDAWSAFVHHQLVAHGFSA